MTQSTKDHPAILEERAAYEATIARLTAELADALTERDDAMALFHAADKQMRTNKAERDALIGAAYEAAAQAMADYGSSFGGYNALEPIEAAAEIRALTPADATAALDRIKAEEYRRGVDVLAACLYRPSGSAKEAMANDEHNAAVFAARTKALANCDCKLNMSLSQSEEYVEAIKAEAQLAGWKRARDAAAAYHDSAAEEEKALSKRYRGGSDPWFAHVQRETKHIKDADAIRALTPPADLAARIAKESDRE